MSCGALPLTLTQIIVYINDIKGKSLSIMNLLESNSSTQCDDVLSVITGNVYDRKYS